MFLSRECTTAEKRFGATELEIAGLVWVVRRIRYMIEGSPKTLIIFTDYAAARPSLLKPNFAHLKLTSSTLASLGQLDTCHSSNSTSGTNLVDNMLYQMHCLGCFIVPLTPEAEQAMGALEHHLLKYDLENDFQSGKTCLPLSTLSLTPMRHPSLFFGIGTIALHRSGDDSELMMRTWRSDDSIEL